MHVATTYTESTVTLALRPEPGDRDAAGGVRLARHQARFRLPDRIRPADVHPDVEALVAILVASPFSSGLRVTRGVSQAFAGCVANVLGVTVGPVDPALTARPTPVDGVVGLAFSAGADSTAALAVLPETTFLSFMRRIDAPDAVHRSRYSDEAALHACRELERQGRRVTVVESDVEHVRLPVGFTTDWVNGAGLLLLADIEHLNGAAWGLIAESAYDVGHEVYADWGNKGKSWGSLFAAVGVPMCQAVAGVSEVGTADIVRRSPYAAISQSCIRGRVGEPCGRCWKCFRKLLLDAAQTGIWPDGAVVDTMLSDARVRHRLEAYPIKHENVIAWTMARYTGDHPVLRRLATRTEAAAADLDWLTRWYGPSADLLPAGCRDDVRLRLDTWLQRMSPEDEARLRAWDLHPILADPAVQAAQVELVAALGTYGGHGARRTTSDPASQPMRWARRLLRRGGH